MTELRPASSAPPHASSDVSTAVIAQARRADVAALTAIHARYAPELLAVAARLVGSRDEAADVVQDLFVGLPEALARYTEQQQFGAWLRRVAVRLALSRLRTRARRREAALDVLPAHVAVAPVPTLDRVALAAAILALPEPQRVVFVLREVEGYTHAEIAVLLGISRAASEVRLFRAVRRLRALLS